MRKSATINNVFAILVGIFLLIEGIWGLFSDVVFSVLTTNLEHSVIHIILGVTAICLGILKMARGYCIVLGLVLLIVGILRFIPGADELVITIFNVNEPVAYLNIVVGIISLIVAFIGKPSKVIA